MYGNYRSVLLIAVLAFAVFSGSAVAAPGEIVVAAPEIDWQAVPLKILSWVSPAVIVGAGITLSMWVIFAAINFFSRSSITISISRTAPSGDKGKSKHR